VGNVPGSALDGQGCDAVLVRELALAHRVLELHAEYRGGPDAAFCGGVPQNMTQPGLSAWRESRSSGERIAVTGPSW
jgi:hypothetical protein